MSRRMPVMDFIDLKTQYRRIKPSVDSRIARVLEHGQYILGPEVTELEAVLARYAGTKHCVAASSGTDTLLIALMALGIGPGDEVITVPFTFFATGEMIALAGATPVFVDIDPRTYNIDPAQIEAAVTPRTRAIMPVSLYGQCADFDAIEAVASRHGLAVIEDGAQSFGATYKGRRSCGVSLIGSTSFFPSKPLGGYGDGGALFTNDDGLAKLMREIRVHGQDRRYHHPRLGVNGRLDSLQAAVLLAKMEVFDEEVAARIRVGARYTEQIEAACGGSRAKVHTPYVEPFNTCIYAQYTVEVDDRDGFEARMKALGIPTAVHYPMALHMQPVFAHLDLREGSFPASEAAARRVVSLPMHPYLTEVDQDRVVSAVAQAAS
jgi:UDP-2-acetamido-2-deoxy-ribo-hexuluronate aminotransferase